MKRPKGLNTENDFGMKSPASELSTQSTQIPFVIFIISSANDSDLESNAW